MSELNTLKASSAEGPGTRIGPYRILQLIGEGGFGSVFMAEQETPVQRRVALKIIKLGMDTRQVVARFDQERQALALMEHPNIARVLDAGATEAGSFGGGRPYFVMDLVKGDPITEYCDKNRLSIDDRLELFAQVCAAVQHAHTKGIIHRDLKPSNILVSTQDGQPNAKVIDFGIAKATSARLTEKTLFTEHKALIGTPEYMSPEQAEGSLDIDTRTDVYSLGVLLYELLTGATPFDSKKLRSAAYGEVQRIIREQEPPKPSTRLSQSGDMLANVAARRHTEPRKLGAIVRGELDWIVMKALEKDRSRRYETASALATDIDRHLHGQAVLAAPPSTAYRLKKFVRRNRGPVLAGAAVAAALLAGIVGFAWQARIAAGERDAAKVERNRAVAAEREITKRADELELVSNFQADMLEQVDPTEAGKLLTADVQARFEAALTKAGVPDDERDDQLAAFADQWEHVNATDAARALIDSTILKPAVEAIEKQFAQQPVVDAALRQALADRYRKIGLYDAAAPLQERALATRRRVLGDEHPDTLKSINGMGALLQSQGKPVEAEAYLREALETRRRVLGEEHADTLKSINSMGGLFFAQGKYDLAEPYFREALEKRRRVLGEEDPETLVSINDMGILLREQGKLSEAEPYLREALEKSRRVRGENDPKTVTSISNLGFLLHAQGKRIEAEPHYREALEKNRRLLGEEHPNTITLINNVGGLLRELGGTRLVEAEPYLREALEKNRRVRGEEHPLTLTSINNMGLLLQDQGKLSEAEVYYRDALEKKRRVHGDEHPSTLISVVSMGGCLEDQGRHAETIELLAPAEAATRKAFTGGNAWRLASLLMNLGKARAGLGEFAAGEVQLLEAHTVFVEGRGPTHKDTRACTQALVDFYTAWHAAEPGRGYETKVAEWSGRLVELDAAAAQPTAHTTAPPSQH